MDSRTRRMLDALGDGECHTAKELAARVGTSDRTVRNVIRAFNDNAGMTGARIKTVYGHGYRLDVSDQAAFATWSASDRENPVPSTPAERRRFVLEYLLTATGYVKKDRPRGATLCLRQVPHR